MDIAIPIIFLIIGFICFIIALLEEINDKKNEEEEDKSSHLVIVLLIASIIFFSVGGICMRMITSLYYSAATDTVHEVYLPSYVPLSWIGYGFTFFAGFFLILKVFERIDFRTAEEG